MEKYQKMKRAQLNAIVVERQKTSSQYQFLLKNTIKIVIIVCGDRLAC